MGQVACSGSEAAIAACAASADAEEAKRERANQALLKASGSGDINAMIAALADGAHVETRPATFKSYTNMDERITSAREEEIVDLKDENAFMPFPMNNHGAAPSSNGATFTTNTLAEASSHGFSTCVNTGLTPLMYAACKGQAMACALLLDMRASLLAHDELGRLPIHLAAASGCRETCKMLLRARASPAAKDLTMREPFEFVPKECLFLTEERDEWVLLLQSDGLDAKSM
mmetsp:Transcript_24740/g.45339  ORF Transcript_24740/g.45339 Transcript_24740/m.45339 type:complete len:231 (-) Transcript_24740:45-737(-)